MTNQMLMVCHTQDQNTCREYTMACKHSSSLMDTSILMKLHRTVQYTI